MFPETVMEELFRLCAYVISPRYNPNFAGHQERRFPHSTLDAKSTILDGGHLDAKRARRAGHSRAGLSGLFYLGASGPKGHEIAHWLEAEA